MAISKQLLAMTYLYFILNFPSLISPLSLATKKRRGQSHDCPRSTNPQFIVYEKKLFKINNQWAECIYTLLAQQVLHLLVLEVQLTELRA